MSSPAGVQQPEISFLTRWMPSRQRAGVVLNPALESWAPRDPDDSFSAQFAPLPASSSSSSCVSVDSLVLADTTKPDELGDRRRLDTPGADRDGCVEEWGCISQAASETSDRPLNQKLEELKVWQRSMQEQLKAQQLDQLQQLLQEQQRLLRTVGQQGGVGPALLTRGLSNWDAFKFSRTGESASPPAVPDPPLVPARSDIQLSPVQPPQWVPKQPSSSQVTDQGCPIQVQGSQLGRWSHSEDEPSDRALGASMWSSCDSYDQGNDSRASEDNTSHDNDDDDEDGDGGGPGPSATNDPVQSAEEEEVEGRDLVSSEDRPIKPGVGGRKVTFEELLEEQLKLEEQRLRSTQLEQATAQEVKAPPKRTFLKRGEGLSRFTRGRAAPPKRVVKDSCSQLSSKPESAATVQKRSIPPRPVIQRKTTTLNKENHVEPRPVGQDRRKPQAKGAGSAHSRPLSSQPRKSAVPAGPRRPRVEQTEVESGGSRGSAGSHGARSEPPPRSVLKRVGGVKGQVQTRSVLATIQPPAACSFDVSFQERLKHWDSERLQEKAELGEFELLEQAAEELSFSSNSSFVMKVLQLDHQANRGRRRLSSTPIKGFKGSQPAETGSGLLLCPSAVKPEAGGPRHESQDALIRHDGDDDSRAQAVVEEISSTGPYQSSLAFGDPDDGVQEQQISTAESGFRQDLGFPIPSDARYDRTSYQDEDTSSDQANVKEVCASNEDSDDFDQAEDDTLVGDILPGGDNHLVFDDDDTWHDEEEMEIVKEDDGDEGGGRSGKNITSFAQIHMETARGFVPPGRALKRKVAAVKGAESETVTKEVEPSIAPPPTSQLVAKLFPSLKAKMRPAPMPVPKPLTAGEDQSTGPSPLSQQLKDRLAELEREIERFRMENATLAHLKQEAEDGLQALRKEVAEFERKKAEELASLEEVKKEEMQKLQRERRVFEKHASAARAIPDKKERQEIQALKQQLSSLQDELRRREARWSSTHNRLRQQIDTLGAENTALRDEVRTLEKLRLAAWKRAESHKEGTSSQSPTGVVQTSTLLTASTRGSSQAGKSAPVPHSLPLAGERSESEPDRRIALPGTASCVSALAMNTPPEPRLLRADPRDTREDREQVQDDSQETITHPDGKIERALNHGGRLIVFPNGTRKEVSQDGRSVTITFFNGDIKQLTEDQRVIYFYAETQTTHTTYPDGMEVLQFPNNQTEKHFPDGRKEITFPDQTVKNLFPNGKEESIFPDGTVIEVDLDGSKVIRFNNGQREVHTVAFKRREYPDGTAKTVYSDGRQETRYADGRLRVKDKDGRVVVDTRP